MILIPKYSNLIEVAGSVSLVLTDQESGEIRQEIYVPNLVVTTGKNFIASSMLKTTTNTPAAMTHMGIGLGSTLEVAGDLALGQELTIGTSPYGYSRAVVTGAIGTSANQVQYSATFAANNPNSSIGSGGAALREAGIFNAATAGTMLCRTTFPVVTKLAADALTITWTITIS
jgi:hypothetical protein